MRHFQIKAYSIDVSGKMRNFMFFTKIQCIGWLRGGEVMGYNIRAIILLQAIHLINELYTVMKLEEIA